MNIKINVSLLLILSLAVNATGQGKHPLLILTKAGVEEIRNTKVEAPLFTDILEKTKAEVDAEIELGIFVPVPKDMSGGYTHERHKLNLFILQKAGVRFLLECDGFGSSALLFWGGSCHGLDQSC